MEPSGDQYEYGSRLTGSSWTPSSGPYTPSSSSVSDQPPKQQQQRTYSGGGATLSGMNSVGTPTAAAAIGNHDVNVIGPTPNSLNARGNGVQFSKAEYKAPNSLQNSLDGGNTASPPPPPPYDDNSNNSSFGRFSEFKSTNQNQNNDDRQRSQSSGRRGRSRGDQDRHARSDDSNLHHQSYNNNNNDNTTNNNNEDDNMTNMTEQTPLERWERRKERKLKEQRGLSPRSSKNNVQQQQQQQRRAVTPTRRTREGASRSVTKDRKTRWSPQEDEDEYYQEYDDFGPATTATTNDTRGRSTEDAHRRDYERSRTRSPSPRRDRRSRSLSRGRGRPDPLGHRESSIGNHENLPVYRDNDNDDDEGEGFLGDVDTGSHHGSSLSVDYHFDNEQRQQEQGMVQQPTTRHHQHRSRSRSASRHRSRSRSVPRRRSRSRSRTRNVTNGGGKKKSTYADELKSFTESIAAPVVAQQHQQQQQQGILHNHNDRQYKPYSDNHADNNMAIMEQGVPISSSSSASYSHRNNNKSLHLSEIEIEEEEGSYTDDSQSQSSVRVRHRASDMCRKFTSCNPRRRRNNEVIYSTSSGSSSKSTKKRCMWIALAVCGVCIVGAVLGIYYTKIYSSENIGEGEEDTTDIAVDASYEPTITLVPSAQPTRATSNIKPNEVAPSEQIIPTHRPHTLRDDMLAEYLSTLTNGLSDVRDTPQYKAKMWLVYEDMLQLHLPYHETSYYGDRNDDTKNDVTNRIKQRYALATLYYAWNMGDNDNMMIYGWLQGDECDFVEHSSESMYGEEEKEQAWEGVGCDDNGMVQALVLGKSFSCENLPSFTIFNLTPSFDFCHSFFSLRWSQPPR